MMHTARPGAAPLWEQLAFAIFGPPTMAILFKFMARGWALTVQGGTVSRKTVKRQRTEFWAMLLAMYLVVWGFLIYGWLT